VWGVVHGARKVAIDLVLGRSKLVLVHVVKFCNKGTIRNGRLVILRVLSGSEIAKMQFLIRVSDPELFRRFGHWRREGVSIMKVFVGVVMSRSRPDYTIVEMRSSCRRCRGLAPEVAPLRGLHHQRTGINLRRCEVVVISAKA
jgi:hypothetical protein